MTNYDASRERASFVHDTAGSLLTVRIRGEIDHHTAAGVRQGIDALLYERRPSKLILDLSAVSFMDSSGLGLIMGRYSVIRELGGDLVVWNPSRETRGILTLAGMERMVKIEYPPTENRAASAVPGTRSTSSARTRSKDENRSVRRTSSGQSVRNRTASTQRKEKDA